MSDARVLVAKLRAIREQLPFELKPWDENQLDELVQQAASRVESEGLAGDPEKLREAEENFHKLTEELRREYAHGDTARLEPIFQSVLSRVCPLWPFC